MLVLLSFIGMTVTIFHKNIAIVWANDVMLSTILGLELGSRSVMVWSAADQVVVVSSLSNFCNT